MPDQPDPGSGSVPAPDPVPASEPAPGTLSAAGPVARLSRDGRARVSESFGQTTADVDAADWIDLLAAARAEGYEFFDWLTAVDEPPDEFAVVAHLFAPASRSRLLLRTRVPRADPRLPSAVGVFRGADWHERETFEMFGVVFEGHPNLVPLLLPEGFEGFPLRKDFVLAARVAKAWPGAKEPGESDHGSPSRRKTLPPGVPIGWGRDRGA